MTIIDHTLKSVRSKLTLAGLCPVFFNALVCYFCVTSDIAWQHNSWVVRGGELSPLICYRLLRTAAAEVRTPDS